MNLKTLTEQRADKQNEMETLLRCMSQNYREYEKKVVFTEACPKSDYFWGNS